MSIAMPGTLYLIPVPLHEQAPDTLPPETLDVLSRLRVLIAERARTARRWIRRLAPEAELPAIIIHELDKHQPSRIDETWLAPALQGQDIGLMSEAGCPGVADPGAVVVARAMTLGIPVRALVGPSSLLLALMGSGLNGQSFAFQGYLAHKKPDLQRDLQRLERLARQTGQTQLFMETPYRNHALFDLALETLQPDTWLSVAADLTSPHAWQRSRPIREWRRSERPRLDKVPAVFLIGRPAG